MAENDAARNLGLQYKFDPLSEEKLAQVFQVLAPEKFGSIDAILETKRPWITKPAVIYAWVSSDRQKEHHTIARQTAALIQYAKREGFAVPSEWIFQEGYSGASIVRPGLEAVRDLAAEGHIKAVLIHSPDG